MSHFPTETRFSSPPPPAPAPPRIITRLLASPPRARQRQPPPRAQFKNMQPVVVEKAMSYSDQTPEELQALLLQVCSARVFFHHASHAVFSAAQS